MRYDAMIQCPECKCLLEREGIGEFRRSKQAIMLYFIAVAASALWIPTLLAWSPVFLVPTGFKGLLLCAVFYLGPGLLIGLWASIVPRERTLRCAGCDWRGIQGSTL